MSGHKHEESCTCGCHEHEHEHSCSCHSHEQQHDAGCACGCHEHEQEQHNHSCGCHSHEQQHDAGCGCGCHDHHDHDHGCSCGCGHDHGNDEGAKKMLPRLLAALALFAAGMLLPVHGAVKTALLAACFAVSGYDVVLSAFRSLIAGRMLSEHFLMAVASLAAMAIGEVTEGCAVMMFYQVGECCQAYAVGKSRRQIKSLLSLKAEEAYVLREDTFSAVNPAEVKPGEVIRIRPGERVPLDAVVVSGVSGMDTSALTGESVARTVELGDLVLAGFVAKDGVITARVEKPLYESSVSRILAMVEKAQERKASAERFITVFARVYTPVVVGLAAALAVLPPLVLDGWRVWMYRALTFLVASCPCALVISVPLCYFAGIGAAARRGILIKGGDTLDALCRIKTFVLDKTGTVTTGEFGVAHVHPANGYDEHTLLALIAGAEKDSGHPLAAAAVREAENQGISIGHIALEKEIAGRGVLARTQDGKTVLAGSEALLKQHGICPDAAACGMDGARIYAAEDGKYAGFICLQDTVKPGAAETAAALKAMGVSKLVMLTGDREAPARAAAEQAGIDDVRSQLLPQDKLAALEEICSDGGAAFVGDGINDAPAIMRADVGVAMGAMGSDAAIEAADVVLMTDEITRLPDMLRTARRVRMLAQQNVAFALAVKVGVLALAAFGLAGMWAAVFADVGVALICVLNAMRAMR